jgi:outer membrane protein TolC
MKKITKRITYGAWLLFFSLISSAGFSQLNIDRCHQKAKENFPLIKQYGLIEQTQEYNLSNANKAYLPQLDIMIIGGIMEGLPDMGAPGTEESGTDLKLISVVQLNQVIWDGGITKAKKKAIEANGEIAKSNLDVTLYALEDRVNNLYFGILLIDEQLKQMEILISTLDRNYKRVEVAVENGTAFLSDLDEIKVEVINVEQLQANLAFNRIAYLNVLAAMIGEQFNKDIVLEMPKKMLYTLSDSINRPELSKFYNQRLLVEAQRDINKAMLYPKLGIMGFGTFVQPGIEFGTSDISNVLVAGLSLSWNLGSLYKNSNNKKLAELDLNSVAIQQETFLFNTNLELRQYKVDLERYKSQIAQDEELLKLKQRIKAAYDVKYENGTCTMSALLDRVNDESVAQQSLAVHQIQYLLKVYQYQILTGNRTNKN